ncbi:LacI family transcriptional regulator [Kribbella steppae]|uniref:LacI family transcriptional regulator n=1 Tax=Kribbella steppae TaxID=2512223 RepID=A0A4R2HP95_9ACTN|nr:LacI family DNA-binding transcriptional regulator [Kribbella steppae]TCO32867.1 LacI family transcriptional regulator [Kribbella steppae]
MSQRKVSIRDVAAHAGVSVTTVSHVLNEAPGKRITDATRARVKQSADELGYAPSSVARNLRLQRSQMLALISDEIATTPYAGRMILGAQEAASKAGWLLMLVNTGFDSEFEAAEIRALRQRQVDGFLYATMYHREVVLPEAIDGVPTVLLDARSDDLSVPSVVPDEVGGGRTATEELIRHGHTRIGFLNNVDDIPATRGRLEGYRAALDDAGLVFDQRLVVEGSSDTEGGLQTARKLLSATDRPTALFCFNDRMAMGAYHAAAELGLRIPEDLSLVGFDNQELIAEGLRPVLTTVALPHYEMGAWAVETLIARIEGQELNGPHQVELSCPLVYRNSVA